MVTAAAEAVAAEALPKFRPVHRSLMAALVVVVAAVLVPEEVQAEGEDRVVAAAGRGQLEGRERR